MKLLLSVLPAILAPALLTACGSDTTPIDMPDAALPDDGFRTLVDSSWSLVPASEKYVCVRKTVTTDTYISTIRPVSPLGTHHAVLMIGPPDQADGAIDCDSSLTKPAIYASGVGTQPLAMPPATAIHVKPGQQLLLNLHLFNASDNTLVGTSGVEFLPADPATIAHEAGVVLVGKAQGLKVVPGASVQTGRCTTPAGLSVFALAPHMHLLGTHMKVTWAEAGGANERILHDEDFQFDGQRFHEMAPALVTTAGGHVTVDCSYFNPTGTTVPFGEHTEEEMCYALTFVSPPPAQDQCLQ